MQSTDFCCLHIPFACLGHHFSLLQHETEKLRNEIEKMRSELRYEMDKVTAGQRLDLNLERGNMKQSSAMLNHSHHQAT
ncbi:hypothetical protein P8452_15829 [Trifolium repens]|nr:hypothetical protein P8452_15829 [Trifolium repens]